MCRVCAIRMRVWMQRQNKPQINQTPQTPTAQTLNEGTSHLKKQNQIRLLAPLSTPAGVERGWGRGGEYKK